MTITFNREIALKSLGCEQELLEHFHNILAQSEPNVLALLTIVVTKADRTQQQHGTVEKRFYCHFSPFLRGIDIPDWL